jgi:hypothetical protein
VPYLTARGDRAGRTMLWYYANMAPIKSSPSKKARRFVLGRARLEKISAVEGIRTSAATRRMFAQFDAEGLTPAQRRKAIFDKHARKG